MIVHSHSITRLENIKDSLRNPQRLVYAEVLLLPGSSSPSNTLIEVFNDSILLNNALAYATTRL